MFTRNQIEEIRKKLLLVGRKDTSLPIAGPLIGDEIISIVQQGQNKQITLNTLREEWNELLEAFEEKLQENLKAYVQNYIDEYIKELNIEERLEEYNNELKEYIDKCNNELKEYIDEVLPQIPDGYEFVIIRKPAEELEANPVYCRNDDNIGYNNINVDEQGIKQQVYSIEND